MIVPTPEISVLRHVQKTPASSPYTIFHLRWMVGGVEWGAEQMVAETGVRVSDHSEVSAVQKLFTEFVEWVNHEQDRTIEATVSMGREPSLADLDMRDRNLGEQS